MIDFVFDNNVYIYVLFNFILCYILICIRYNELKILIYYVLYLYIISNFKI